MPSVRGEILGHDRERAAEHLRSPGPEHAAVDRREEPLVRVHHDRVGALGAVEHPAQLRRDRGRAAVRRVDVEPEAVLLADAGDRGDRIDARRRRRARGGDHRERPDPGGDVLVDRLAQRDRVHAEALVDRESGAVRRVRCRARCPPSPRTSAPRSRRSSADVAAPGRPAMPSSRMRRSVCASRAAASAYSVLDDAVSLITPNSGSGSPTIWRSQSSATCSSSVAAGAVRQSIALTFSAAARVSPRIPGPDPLEAK